MNDRIGFANWANIGKYPFNLAYTDHCHLGRFGVLNW